MKLINRINLHAGGLIDMYKGRKYTHLFDQRLRVNEWALMLPFIHFLSRRDTGVIFDIGAADGWFSTGVSKLRNVKQVVAFEPLPSAYRTLSERVDGHAKISCHNYAVGAKSGAMPFYVTRDGDSSSCLEPNKVQSAAFPTRGLDHKISVEVAPLDELVARLGLPFPHLIKIDTQGYELQVLIGAGRVLRHARYCIVECSFVPLYHNAPVVEDIYEHFRSLGWKLVAVTAPLTEREGCPVQSDFVFERRS